MTLRRASGSFRGIIDEYEKMINDFGLIAIDATRSIEEQQVELRRIVSHALAGTKKTRIRRWLDSFFGEGLPA